ncbi:MAG: TIGR04282 family arsenosugar biosynthesis glycosyltransferase [Methyloceanibacter sp.]
MARSGARRPRRAGYGKHLVIMAKSPHFGRVKRRLAREIGAVATMRFYRSCLSHTALRVAQDRRWRPLLAVDPDRDVGAGFEPSRKKLPRMKQGKGDLGQRLRRLFAALPPGPAIIVGSDIPAIEAGHIAHAFRLLGRNDAVLGPATDGGYWLIGLKRTPSLLAPFNRVRWSSRHALADTLANLKGKRVASAATLSDVDSQDDYRNLRRCAQRLILPPANCRRLTQL